MDEKRAFTVALFGHRYLDNHNLVYDKLYELALDIVSSRDSVNFIMGRNGDFDLIAASCIRALKKMFPEKIILCFWIMPYSMAEYRENEQAYDEYYDGVYVCDKSYKVHPKAAIGVRNRWMVEISDLVMGYVATKSGGAFNALKYAERIGKKSVNIFTADTGEMM